MVNVAAVRAKDGEAYDATADDGERDIEDGQREGEDGSDEGRGDGAFVGTLDGQATNQKAEKVSAAIAEVNARGREIEPKEADERAGHSSRNTEGKGVATETDVNQEAHQHQANAGG